MVLLDLQVSVYSRCYLSLVHVYLRSTYLSFRSRNTVGEEIFMLA